MLSVFVRQFLGIIDSSLKLMAETKTPTRMSCWYLVTGLFHPYITRLDTSHKLVTNQLTNDRYSHFHGHPSR